MHAPGRKDIKTRAYGDSGNCKLPAIAFGGLQLVLELMLLAQAPITSLDMYLDGESTVEEDLVALLSMGIVHVPRSEVSAQAHLMLLWAMVTDYALVSHGIYSIAV